MVGIIKTFIGYSNQDVYHIHQLYESLEAVGSGPYVAEWWLEAGRPLAEKIKRNLAESTCLVTMLSDEANSSAWVHEEIGYAIGRGVPVIPVIEEGVKIRGFLEGLEFIPYSKDDFDETIYRIITNLRASIYLAPLPGLPIRALDTLKLTCKVCNIPFFNSLPFQEQINTTIKKGYVFLYKCPNCFNEHKVNPKTFKIIS